MNGLKSLVSSKMKRLNLSRFIHCSVINVHADVESAWQANDLRAVVLFSVTALLLYHFESCLSTTFLFLLCSFEQLAVFAVFLSNATTCSV